MCKLGDIIVVNKYTAENGEEIGRHSFIVIDDNPNYIRGLSYTHVTTVISSFKSQKHKNKKLRFKENLEIFEFENNKVHKFFKPSYIKADKLFYFNKDKLDYYILGRISEDLLDELIKLIIELANDNKITIVTENL